MGFAWVPLVLGVTGRDQKRRRGVPGGFAGEVRRLQQLPRPRLDLMEAPKTELQTVWLVSLETHRKGRPSKKRHTTKCPNNSGAQLLLLAVSRWMAVELFGALWGKTCPRWRFSECRALVRLDSVPSCAQGGLMLFILPGKEHGHDWHQPRKGSQEVRSKNVKSKNVVDFSLEVCNPSF